MILTKNLLKGELFTEKFALLNLIKALGGLSVPPEQDAEKASPPPTYAKTSPAPPENEVKEYNAMANVIAKHEQISNRVHSVKKNNGQKAPQFCGAFCYAFLKIIT